MLSNLIYKSVFWRTINLLSVFILNLVISHLFSAEIYGNLFFTINKYALALLICGLCLEAGISYFVSKNELNSFYAALLSFLWSLVASFFIAIYFGLTEKLNLPKYTNSFLFLYLFGQCLLTFFIPLFNVKYNYIVPNLIISITNIALCFVLICISINSQFIKIDSVKIAYFITFFLQGILLMLYFFYKFKDNKIIYKDFNVVLFQKIFKYSIQVFVLNFLFFLMLKIDYWFVNYYCINKNLLGNYIQVSKLAQLFFIIPSIIANTLFSVTASGNNTLVEKNIIQVVRYIFNISLLICVGFALFGYWIFPFIYGKYFNEMYVPFLYLIPGILSLTSLFPFIAFFSGINQIKQNLIASCIALIFICIGDFILVPLFNINGAALVSSVGYFLCFAYSLYYYKKHFGLKLKDCFLLKKSDIGYFKSKITKSKL